MDDEYGTFTVERPSRQLRWQAIAAVVLSGAGCALEQISETLEAVAHQLMCAGNYADDRQTFHEEAALELETLLEGDDG